MYPDNFNLQFGCLTPSAEPNSGVVETTASPKAHSDKILGKAYLILLRLMCHMWGFIMSHPLVIASQSQLLNGE